MILKLCRCRIQNHLISKTFATLPHQPPKLIWLKDLWCAGWWQIMSRRLKLFPNVLKWYWISAKGSAEMISGVGAEITFYLEKIETSAGKLIFNAWRVCPNDLKLAINITYWCFRMLFKCSWTWLVGFHFGSIFFWFSFHWHPTNYLRSCNLIPFTWCLWHKTDAW